MEKKDEPWDAKQFRFTFVGMNKKTGKVEFRTYNLIGAYTGAQTETLGLDGIE